MCLGVGGNVYAWAYMHMCPKDPAVTKRHISALTWLTVAWGRMMLMKSLLESVVIGLTGKFRDSLRIHTNT